MSSLRLPGFGWPITFGWRVASAEQPLDNLVDRRCVQGCRQEPQRRHRYFLAGVGPAHRGVDHAGLLGEGRAVQPTNRGHMFQDLAVDADTHSSPSSVNAVCHMCAGLARRKWMASPHVLCRPCGHVARCEVGRQGTLPYGYPLWDMDFSITRRRRWLMEMSIHVGFSVRSWLCIKRCPDGRSEYGPLHHHAPTFDCLWRCPYAADPRLRQGGSEHPRRCSGPPKSVRSARLTFPASRSARHRGRSAASSVTSAKARFLANAMAERMAAGYSACSRPPR